MPLSVDTPMLPAPALDRAQTQTFVNALQTLRSRMHAYIAQLEAPGGLLQWLQLGKQLGWLSLLCLPGPLPEEVAQCVSLAEALALLCPLEGVPDIATRITLMAKRVQCLQTQGLSMAPEEQALWLGVYTEASDLDRALGDILVWFEDHGVQDGSALLTRAYPHLKPAPQKAVLAAGVPLPSHVANPSETHSAFVESAATPSTPHEPSGSISTTPAMTYPSNPHHGSHTPVHALPYVQPSAPSLSSASSTPKAANPTPPLPPSEHRAQSSVSADFALPAAPSFQQTNTLSQAGPLPAPPNVPLFSTGHASATAAPHARHSSVPPSQNPVRPGSSPVSADDQQDAPSAVTQHVTTFLVEAKCDRCLHLGQECDREWAPGRRIVPRCSRCATSSKRCTHSLVSSDGSIKLPGSKDAAAWLCNDGTFEFHTALSKELRAVMEGMVWYAHNALPEHRLWFLGPARTTAPSPSRPTSSTVWQSASPQDAIDSLHKALDGVPAFLHPDLRPRNRWADSHLTAQLLLPLRREVAWPKVRLPLMIAETPSVGHRAARAPRPPTTQEAATKTTPRPTASVVPKAPSRAWLPSHLRNTVVYVEVPPRPPRRTAIVAALDYLTSLHESAGLNAHRLKLTGVTTWMVLSLASINDTISQLHALQAEEEELTTRPFGQPLQGVDPSRLSHSFCSTRQTFRWQHHPLSDMPRAIEDVCTCVAQLVHSAPATPHDVWGDSEQEPATPSMAYGPHGSLSPCIADQGGCPGSGALLEVSSFGELDDARDPHDAVNGMDIDQLPPPSMELVPGYTA